MRVFPSAGLMAALLLAQGCLYDYSGLAGRSPDASIGISGSGGVTAPGSGGDAHIAPAGDGSGGTGTGTGANAGSGSGGSPVGMSGGAGADPSASGGTQPGGTAGSGTGGGASAGSGGGGTGGTSPAGGGGTIGTGGVATGGVTGSGGGAGAGAAAGRGGGLGGGGGAGGAGAAIGGSRILSIDFIGGSTPDRVSGGAGTGGSTATFVNLPRMASTEVAGVKPAANWNGALGAMGTLAGLVAADGSVTSATVRWDSPLSATLRGTWSLGYVDAPGDVRMMNGYLDPHSPDMPDAPATVTVTGLPAAVTAGGYDVYVYTSGELTATAWARSYRYAIGASAVSFTQAGRSATTFGGYVQARDGVLGNYVVFRNLSGASFTLTATPGPSSAGAGDRAPVNGLQIVAPSGS